MQNRHSRRGGQHLQGGAGRSTCKGQNEAAGKGVEA